MDTFITRRIEASNITLLYVIHVIRHPWYMSSMSYVIHVIRHPCHTLSMLYVIHVIRHPCYTSYMLYVIHSIRHPCYTSSMLYVIHAIRHPLDTFRQVLCFSLSSIWSILKKQSIGFGLFVDINEMTKSNFTVLKQRRIRIPPPALRREFKVSIVLL